MNMNDGKQKERKIFNFLGHDLIIDKIPAGCAVPFSIEIDKVRAMSIKAAESVAQDADTEDDLERLTLMYFANPENAQESHEISMQTIKAISVFTEYITDGVITEDYIKHNADMEEVNELMIQVQEAVNAPLKKHLAKLTQEEKK
jgi:uncharacterized protein HemY